MSDDLSPATDAKRDIRFLLQALKTAGSEIEQLRAKVEKMRARMTELQEPEGHREEWVAEWLRGRGYTVSKTIEEQRKVKGFGDPQYTCGETELAIRVAIYTWLQQRKAAGEIVDLTMSQDWSGNTLHLKGLIRPMDLARAVAAAVAENSKDAKDAERYRWLRDDGAYVPEEEYVRGGDDLDRLCDEGIASANEDPKPPS